MNLLVVRGPPRARFIGLGAMEGTKPYKFIGFGVTEGTKPYKFIGFWELPRRQADRGSGGAATP